MIEIQCPECWGWVNAPPSSGNFDSAISQIPEGSLYECGFCGGTVPCNQENTRILREKESDVAGDFTD
jgi:hypothetical protein